MNIKKSKIMIHTSIPFAALAILLATGCSSQPSDHQAHEDHESAHGDSHDNGDSHEGEKSEVA